MSGDTMTAEARALHAALADDLDGARRILRDFLPGELRALQRACGLLSVLCVDVRRDPSSAPGPATPTQHGLRPPRRKDAAGSRVLERPAPHELHRHSPHPTSASEGGADVVPPELGEDASS